jgi:hypothetical protein
MRIAPRHVLYFTVGLMTGVGSAFSVSAYAAGLRGPAFLGMTFVMGAAGTLLVLLMAALFAVRQRRIRQTLKEGELVMPRWSDPEGAKP